MEYIKHPKNLFPAPLELKHQLSEFRERLADRCVDRYHEWLDNNPNYKSGLAGKAALSLVNFYLVRKTINKLPENRGIRIAAALAMDLALTAAEGLAIKESKKLAGRARLIFTGGI